MTSLEIMPPARPTDGRIVLVTGFSEPQPIAEAAAKALHSFIPGEPDVQGVSVRWSMENPKAFATMLLGARLLTTSAGTITLPEAQKHTSKPGLGLIEAVGVASVEERLYRELMIGYGELLIQQETDARENPETPEGQSDGRLVRAKLGELVMHPIKDVRYLRKIRRTSTMGVFSSLAGETGIPVVIGYTPNDPFGFKAPEGDPMDKFIAAGGVLVRTLPNLGHEGLLGPKAKEVVQPMYPDLDWPLQAA